MTPEKIDDSLWKGYSRESGDGTFSDKSWRSKLFFGDLSSRFGESLRRIRDDPDRGHTRAYWLVQDVSIKTRWSCLIL